MKSSQEGNEEEGKATHLRTSGRKRKQPVTKSDDFFMDIKSCKMSTVLPTVSSDKKFRNQKIVVLHQNVCSLRAKVTELEVLLCS
jgi:hypothetical protein